VTALHRRCQQCPTWRRCSSALRQPSAKSRRPCPWVAAVSARTTKACGNPA